MDARSFHILPDDLPPRHMCGDDVFSPLRIHPIIQGSGAARSRQRRKPAAEQGRGLRGEDLPHQHVGTLGAPAKAALPRNLGVLARTMCVQRRVKDLSERHGSVALAALRPAADQDLEVTNHWLLSVTGARRPVNQRPRAGPARASAVMAEPCRWWARACGRWLLSAPPIADSATTSAWIQQFCRSWSVRGAGPKRRSATSAHRAADPAASSPPPRPGCSISSITPPAKRRP